MSSTTNTPDPSNSAMITSAIVRQICGGISHQSLHRWLNSPAVAFPKPKKISGRHYWRRSDIDAWLSDQESVA
jgi:predicted DNA-binding transcriptional regulator AlpA